MGTMEKERVDARWQRQTRECLASFGERIRNRRRGLGLTQSEVGELCGLHRTYVADIEAGRRNISFVNLLRIAAAVGSNLSEVSAGLALRAEG